MRMTLLNIVFGSVSFDLSAVCGTCLPGGCAVATHSLGDWTGSEEGDPNWFWGRSPHLAEARSGFWEGERASEGRGCFERGTLDADRKANRKGAAPFQRPFLMARIAKASSEYLKCHSEPSRSCRHQRNKESILRLAPGHTGQSFFSNSNRVRYSESSTT